MALMTIRGVEIQFPYTPYKVQEDYMSKVIECLQMGINGILESPTGTGKTLSLLCSSLAWLESKKAHHQLLVLQHSSNETIDGTALNGLRLQIEGAAGVWNSPTNFMLPKIIYSSRTHAQLSQAIQELKRTSYKHVRSIVVGSRDQMCLHPEVSKIQNNVTKVYACRSKISSKTCPFYLNYEEKITSQKEYQDIAVMDIEDLIVLGKKHTCCPYYVARHLKTKADMIFAPYNYIIDPKTRRSQGIELEGNIVIFDEAHNIEGACEESMSFQLRSLDLAMCINEVNQTIAMIKEMENQESPSSDSGQPDFTLTDLTILKVMFCELEEQLDKEVSEIMTVGVSKPGDYMIDLLSRVELTPQKRDVVLELLDKIIIFHSTAAVSPLASKGNGLQKFSDIIKILFSRTVDDNKTFDFRKEFSHKYRVYLQCEVPNKTQNLVNNWTTVMTGGIKKRSWKLDCWCFSPGIGMQDVMSYGIHSMLLTSGTLSPLAPLVCELGISFPVQLENPHIICDKQIFVAVITQGPDGTPLNSSYQNRFNDKYISSLGRTVSNFCRLIPDGVLTFFPSYSVMKGNVSKWEEMGIWQSLSGIKPVFVEPQNKDAFQESIDKFYSRINDPACKGAILLGVCRGKVSEGLDFADKNARGVIITGLPFPPSMDPRVKMKMSYLNDAAKENKSLLGTEWYVLQASRAINQAIGRVIRHKDDFGAIILCDNRFAEKRIQCQLSHWIQNKIKVFNSFGPALKQLSSFFRELEQNFSKVAASKQSSPTLGGFKVNSYHISKKIHTALPNSIVEDNSAEKLGEHSKSSNIFDTYLSPQGSIKSVLPPLARNDQTNSIFDALEECVDATESKPTSSSSFLNQNEVISSVDISRQVKRRKINIKLRKADEQESNSVGHEITDRETWKAYLMEVKSLLADTHLYANFCSAIKGFRSSKNTTEFATRICQIFSNMPEKEKYIEKTSALVNLQERKKFLALCSVNTYN